MTPLRATVVRLMRARGIQSNADLARRVGWPYETMRAYLSGRRALPALRAIQLARVLETTVEELLAPHNPSRTPRGRYSRLKKT